MTSILSFQPVLLVLAAFVVYLWSQRQLTELSLKPGICLPCIATLTNEVQSNNDDWTLDLLRAHVGHFAPMFPHYFEGRKLVPLSITGLSLFQLVTHITRKREWRTRQRQTDNFWSLMCFFFFSGLMCLRQPIDGLGGVSGPSLPPDSINTTSSWLIWELVVREDRDPAGTAVSSQLVAMYLCTLPCLYSHLQGEASQRTCWKNQFVAAKLGWLDVYICRRIRWSLCV